MRDNLPMHAQRKRQIEGSTVFCFTWKGMEKVFNLDFQILAMPQQRERWEEGMKWGRLLCVSRL